MSAPTRRSDSLAWRALLAVALMIGFYVLALGISAALLYIPYAEWKYTHHINLKVIALCVGGAGAILLSIVPRADRFAPPGPQLAADEQPRLFGALRGVAEATGQAMPAEVYLIPDANAWVSQRGGVMGFHSRRVMGLGLPLLRALTVPQFSAVIAHEFGHFHAGDTRLGPWIYKTRGAIGRTLQGLADNSFLQKPFEWYGSTFLRVTQAISRRQELAADALAAEIVGARPLGEGLRAVHGVALAYDAYWRTELLPVVQSGFLPPIADGFHAFLSAPAVAASLERATAAHAEESVADPYDSHPALRDRLAALADLPTAAPPTDAMPAIGLLDDVAGLERQLLGALGANVGALDTLSWADVEAKVWIPAWRRVTEANAEALRGVTAAGIADIAGDLSSFVAKLSSAPQSTAPEHLEAAANQALGAALASALQASGWSIHAGLGEPASATRNGSRILPFNILPELSTGALSADVWRQVCAQEQIADLTLAVADAEPIAATPRGYSATQRDSS